MSYKEPIMLQNQMKSLPSKLDNVDNITNTHTETERF